ncbi:RNA 2',3'-cyclic phosphodiesterase [Pseudoduganella eburnea]|uniref:RNA 2',3'-cyclic phosphodiesterase n=1 Tax=Massilia eburnea TaxID=1776165 RepID=A0A6L6QHT0_9BURK|nr:RNA 2',3'-cyclic phosphodiesterase [Massilia eburnea]MTW11775.1 RNA 2',3'-cyclic phosphodiesterase [Massilia eburnea]
MIANQPAHKLFFALWPDPAARQALVRLQQAVRGRLIPPEKLHLTMAFLGRQPAQSLPVLLEILEGMPAVALRLSIDCYGYFKRPQIAWAGPSAPPAALLALQSGLMERLVAAGFSAATHGEFRPHITLAREANEAPGEFGFEPVVWNVSGLSLVESMSDGRYLPIAQTR